MVLKKSPAKDRFSKISICVIWQSYGHCCRKYPGIKAIIHFAALKAVGESVEKPLEYYGNNLISMINLLQDHAGIQHIPPGVFLLLHGLRTTG